MEPTMEQAKMQLMSRLDLCTTTEFDRSMSRHMQPLQFDVLSNFQNFAKNIFLFSGRLVGVSAALYFSNYTGPVLVNCIYAVIEDKKQFEAFLKLCTNGGIGVYYLGGTLTEIRTNMTAAFVAQSMRVFHEPAIYNLATIIRPPVFTIEMLSCSQFSLDVMPLGKNVRPCTISETMQHVIHKELYPLSVQVLQTPDLFSTYVYKSVALRAALGWNAVSIEIAGHKHPLGFVTDENETCAITLEKCVEFLQLWCGHKFHPCTFANFVSTGGHACPVCRAVFIL